MKDDLPEEPEDSEDQNIGKSEDIDEEDGDLNHPPSLNRTSVEEDLEQYYLEVVNDGEEPRWPRPEEELDVFSQDLGGSMIQYWAYPKGSGKTSADLPEAERMAQKYPTAMPSILIDQPEEIELILVKDHHAYAKTESSLSNLEDNLTSIIEVARDKFNLKIEHFLTTNRVSPSVEARLDEMEGTEEEIGGEPDKSENQNIRKPEYQNIESSGESNVSGIPGPSEPFRPVPTSGIYASRPTDGPKSSKLALILPIVLVLAVFGGAIYFRGEIMTKIQSFNAPKQAPTPAPEPTPTPTPTPIPVERANYKVRVLNGTTTAGAAGKLAEKLKELGWQIDKTGNNSDQTIEETTIKAKPGTPDYVIEGLQKDLTDYSAASSSANLKATDKADLEIVIGKK